MFLITQFVRTRTIVPQPATRIAFEMNDLVEVLPVLESEFSSTTPYMEAWVATVNPQECSAFVQWLSQEYPLRHPLKKFDLSHLKRVKRVVGDSSSSPEPPPYSVKETTRKRSRSSINDPNKKMDSVVTTLQVLVVAKSEEWPTAAALGQTAGTLLQRQIAAQLQRRPVELVAISVPRRPPQSEDEFQKFNAIWPTVYLPNQMQEYQEQQRQLDDTETDKIRLGLENALDDFKRLMGGVVICCPSTGLVISTASQEFQAQHQRQCNIQNNPLVTPYILAIQGVSRIERMSWGLEKQQYLCTGYDVYGVQEPNVFEAMALVHSRIRRLVFGVEANDFSEGRSHSSGIIEARVHALPGTNHHFRSFTCVIDSDLQKRCRSAAMEQR
jgi:tRNA(Arg) A34 adenosine deaminase TadA